MSTFTSLYKSKLRTPEEAVKVVKSGDQVNYNHFAMSPKALDAALAKRAGELKDIQLKSVMQLYVPQTVLADLKQETFFYHSGYFSPFDRALAEKGLCYYVASNFGFTPFIARRAWSRPADVFMTQVAPMDKYGYFNFSTTCSETMALCEMAKHIIVEVNEKAPVALGGEQHCIHVSQIDTIVENTEPLFVIPSEFEASEEEKKIAEFIVERMKDGDCLQFGIGSLPSIIAKLIAQSDLKDLGIHSEMMADSFVDLYEQGKITGNRKNLDKGRMTYTFAVGSQRLYDFIDHNPACAIYPVDLVNMPHRIAMNDNQIAINNAVAVDLYGQVSSESEGFKQISGTGGQLEFTLGAEWSKGGAAYICMTSTTMHKGEKVSRIVPYFSPGTIVTCTRGTVSNIVTEYGVANMMGKPVYDRAEMLINIAHPDFRDDLVKAAQEQKIWTKTNKIL